MQSQPVSTRQRVPHLPKSPVKTQPDIGAPRRYYFSLCFFLIVKEQSVKTVLLSLPSPTRRTRHNCLQLLLPIRAASTQRSSLWQARYHSTSCHLAFAAKPLQLCTLNLVQNLVRNLSPSLTHTKPSRYPLDADPQLQPTNQVLGGG